MLRENPIIKQAKKKFRKRKDDCNQNTNVETGRKS